MKARMIRTLALILALLASATGMAQGGIDPQGVSPQGSTDTINFQGQLTGDGGNPLTGSYDMRFSIYDAGTEGTAVWGPETHNGVSVSGGLFVVQLGSSSPLSAGVFDGGDRWLQVEAHNGSDWETLDPRLQISSAAYAISAGGLKPGTTISGSTSDGVLIVSYTEGGMQSRSPDSPGAFFGSAVVAKTDSSANDATAVYAEATATNGRTYGVRGYTNSTSDNTTGVYGQASATSGMTFGVWGYNKSTTDNATGVLGQSDATSGMTFGVAGSTGSTTSGATGVFGQAIATSGQTYGVWGGTNSTTGDAAGVYGKAIATSGQTHGVIGETKSTTDNAAGVNGEAWGDSGKTYGVIGETKSTTSGATGVYGQASGDSGATNGVWGRTNSTTGEASGVYGYAGGGAGKTYGVYGKNDSDADGAAGIYGLSFTPIGETYGVKGESGSESTEAAGVYGAASDAAAGGRFESDSGIGVYVKSNSGNVIEGYNSGQMVFKVDNSGNVYAASYNSPAADFAEMLPAVENLEPGDVLAIGLDGRVAKASAENPTALVGVYSTDPAFLGGSTPLTTSSKANDQNQNVPVAIIGVVPVKVTTENGPIRPNDPLTASSASGYAAKAIPLFVLEGGEGVYAGGTLLGRALEGLDSGEGTILVLLQLR